MNNFSIAAISRAYRRSYEREFIYFTARRHIKANEGLLAGALTPFNPASYLAYSVL